MKPKKQIWTSLLFSIIMLLLILDSKTAFSGAQEGIKMCIQSVIPALFPLIFLSLLIRSSVANTSFSVLKPIQKICKLPKGSGMLFLLGILCGYPVGAQCITEAYKHGELDKPSAHRMLGFCSNAGPAFIFGILSHLFSSMHMVWALWAIHIVSAIIVGMILPAKRVGRALEYSSDVQSLPQAFTQSVKTVTNICGWVVLSRVLIQICNRWFLWMLPQIVQTTLIGIIELTNGCFELSVLQNEGFRFILCSCFLSLGGLCVTMQTFCVTAGLGPGLYIPGKILQFLISLLLSVALQPVVFEQKVTVLLTVSVIVPTITFIFIFIRLLNKKSSSNPALNVV